MTSTKADSAPAVASATMMNVDMGGALSGLKDIADAYKTIATENMETITSSVQAIAAVRNPTEFFELQQKMMKANLTAAMSNSSKLAKLTSAFFTATLAPMQNQASVMLKTAGR
tara:strand:- start:2724 stop:3065 length:342 start_codon:yes stop_codon:yes gene_type:complete